MKNPALFAVVVGMFAATLVSPVQAEARRCNKGCESDHRQCVTRLGIAAQGNCRDSFKLCVQRCDPSGLNMVYLESQATERLLQSHAATALLSVACAGSCKAAAFSTAKTR